MKIGARLPGEPSKYGLQCFTVAYAISMGWGRKGARDEGKRLRRSAIIKGRRHSQSFGRRKASKDGEHEARKEGHRGSSSSADIALPTHNQPEMKAAEGKEEGRKNE